ncbi:CoA pyrophosphatase [Yimella sp. cx-51]|uniref:NUDIX hydrolase n=1 Tax=Yimella sp. cx-51 TaxID=2770551 RepID=UPI00165DC1E1|nr:CoA pyrophosphatase [Yimella sp. cx-51]MBC9956428.1 CoA pyrophosphatase [Yimella sp. cx-51]QTH38455.1 CoA pyrophosphatase [Yimella sp. cx-51]
MTHPAPAWLPRLMDGARAGGSFFNSFGEPDGRRSAVLMLFGPAAGGGEDVLLTQRSEVMRKHPGQVSFPGGGIDPDDADASAAALREAHEEVDLDARGVEVIGELQAVPLSVTGYHVTPVVAWWQQPGQVHAKSLHEVDRVARVRLADLADPQHRFTAVHPSRRFAAPAFEVDGLYVWGFTAILLDAVLRLSGFEQPWATGDERPVPPRFLQR